MQIIDEAFIGCDRLATVTLGTGACEGLEGSFSNCESLERFVVAEDNTWYSLGEYGELFNKDQTVLFLVPRSISGCYVVPDTVTRIADNAFEECGSLSGLIIPDNVETIGDHAFVCCDGVQGILFAGSAP